MTTPSNLARGIAKRWPWLIAAVLLGVAALVLGWYCFILSSSDAIQRGEDFELQWYRWGFDSGSDFITISSNGNAEYMVRDDEKSSAAKCFRKSFIVDEKRMANLVRNLNSLGIMALDDVYREVGTDDGEVWYFDLKTNERTKSIYCANEFPVQLKTLRSFLGDTIVKQLAEPIPPVPISVNEFRSYRSAITRNVRVR